MDVTQTTAAGPSALSSGPSQTAQSAISADFELFLRMLTAQMTNQDPLDPQDSADYAVQLATFSSVEQQVTTNELLAGIGSQFALSGLSDMAGWIGMEARAAMPGHFDGSPITIAPNPAAVAASVELVVRNSLGTEVQRLPLPVSAELFQWTGRDASGQPLLTGEYSFDIVSLDSQGEVLLSEPAEIYQRVREVRSQGGTQILILDGGGAVASTEVTALRDP